MKLVVAARTSKLSRKQVEITLNYIAQKLGNITYQFLGVKTTGDIVKDKPLHLIGKKGVFEKEVNNAVLEGKADIAVHSLKDLPSKLPNGLEIVLIPPRGPREDSLVPRKELPPTRPSDLPKGTRVAAGSPRRQGMLYHANPNIETVWIRGNLDTRLRKLDNGQADYLVVAEAGLTRLRISRPRIILPAVKYVPAPGQGLIAVVAVSETSIARKLKEITHSPSTLEAIAERTFLESIKTGCGAPIGATAWYNDGSIKIISANYDVNLEKPLYITITHNDPVEAGKQVARLLREA